MQDYLTMPWIFAMGALLILASLVIGHFLSKKEQDRKWHLLAWYSWTGLFILIFMTACTVMLFGNQQAVNQANRQNECRQKALPSVLQNPDNSMLDIKFILEKVCK